MGIRSGNHKIDLIVHYIQTGFYFKLFFKCFVVITGNILQFFTGGCYLSAYPVPDAEVVFAAPYEMHYWFCFQNGDMFRKVLMIGGSFSMIRFTSSIVLVVLRLKRIVPWAAVNGTPMALKT
jgi:hypothetical protein